MQIWEEYNNVRKQFELQYEKKRIKNTFKKQKFFKKIIKDFLEIL